MGIVLVNAMMSLDGFIAGPNDEMDWVFEYPVAPNAPDEAAEEVIRTTGAVLGGRRGYEVGRSAQRPETSKAFGGRWSGPVFILTHEPPRDEQDPTIRFVSGDIRRAVATALEAADGKNLLVLGANVVGQCLGAGLVDEIWIRLAPVLLGDGVRLFGASGGRPINLETISVTQVGATGDLRFRVVK
jgi:dihydrofolate reductase